MREARIILPETHHSDGHSLAPIHAWLKRSLAADFGGYTATPSFGGWVAPDGTLYEEKGTAYDVAADDDRAGELRTIAQFIAGQAEQLAVYLRLPDGHVEFVEAPKAPALRDVLAHQRNERVSR